jgi:hypothetical protein
MLKCVYCSRAGLSTSGTMAPGLRIGDCRRARGPLPATCRHAMLGECRLFGRHGIHKNPAAWGSIRSFAKNKRLQAPRLQAPSAMVSPTRSLRVGLGPGNAPRRRRKGHWKSGADSGLILRKDEWKWGACRQACLGTPTSTTAPIALASRNRCMSSSCSSASDFSSGVLWRAAILGAQSLRQCGEALMFGG